MHIFEEVRLDVVNFEFQLGKGDLNILRKVEYGKMIILRKFLDQYNHSFDFVSTSEERYFKYTTDRKYSFSRYKMSYDGFVYEKNRIAPFGACGYSNRNVRNEDESETRTRIESDDNNVDDGCVDLLMKLPECRIDKYNAHVTRSFIYGHGFM